MSGRKEWVLINIDKKEGFSDDQSECIDGLCSGNLTRQGEKLFDLLSEKKWIPVTEIMKRLKINYKKYRGPRPLGHLQLPVEIISMILHEIEHPADIFCLGACNTLLMILVEKRLRKLMPTSSWLGDRLICIENGTEKNTLPKGVREILLEEYTESPDNQPVSRENADAVDKTVRIRFKLSVFHSLDKQWHALRRNTSRVFCRRSPFIYDCFIRDLTIRRTPASDADVLWNLSKKVYVHSEVVVRAFEELHPGWKVGVNVPEAMGTILFLYIAWMPDIGRRHHCGTWAGDRFEFTNKAVMEFRLNQGNAGWKDVSEEALGLFKDVFWNDMDRGCLHLTERNYGWYCKVRRLC